ncbi:hypothetical protein PsYK624_048270 [Phanerochaete sordida]|uniref:Uncharacterized protein n=1 Tax=Phanerochaete sordida TaxID=48140 RepID=A0A9P3G791_9APHY|nr:hypothetical protein PsYK624_048270 [Phanerochaete sordida]
MPATDSSQKSSGRAAQYTEVRYPSSMTVPTDAQPLSQNDEVEVRIEGNLWVAGIVIAVLEAVNRVSTRSAGLRRF